MTSKIVKLGQMTLAKNERNIQLKKHELIDLFWECTLSCNAACKHCGSSAEKRKYEGELTTEEIKNAFCQIAHDMDARKIMVNVTGGEPLMRHDLYEVMEYATKELGFHWGMTSNGMLLTKENIEKLKKANMETISISIDGLSQTHDSFRGVPGSYERILRSITNLKNANFLKHIQVTTVVNKSNIQELEELYEVMKSLSLDSWRIATMDPIGRANENSELLLNGKEMKQVLDFVVTANQKGALRVDYGCPGFLGINYEMTARPWPFNCRTGINVASILYNGDLFVCPNVPRIPRLIQGNIRTDNFADVWNHKYQEFRSKERTKCKMCNKCTWWDYCLGGAFHTWNFEDNKQNKCPYQMMKEG